MLFLNILDIFYSVKAMLALLDGRMAAYSYRLVMKFLTYLSKMRSMIKHTFFLNMKRFEF